jgi:hypothetical protein
MDPDLVGSISNRAMLAVTENFLSEAAAQQWIAGQMKKTRLRAMEYANGAAMELIPAQETAAMWVGICRGLLQGAPNYSETKFGAVQDDEGKIVMEVRLASSPEAFTVTVQRHGPGKLTPHEARVKAERAIEAAWQWIADANDGLGGDPDDLGAILTELGYPPVSEEEA